MYLKEIYINDEYYHNILNNIRKFVPDFITIFDSEDVYPIMFEFANYIIENIENEDKLIKCIEFINEALEKGNTYTEDMVVLQVFHMLYENRKRFNNFEILLKPDLKSIYEKHYRFWLK